MVCDGKFIYSGLSQVSYRMTDTTLPGYHRYQSIFRHYFLIDCNNNLVLRKENNYESHRFWNWVCGSGAGCGFS